MPATTSGPGRAGVAASAVRAALRAAGRFVAEGLATDDPWCWMCGPCGAYPVARAVDQQAARQVPDGRSAAAPS